MAPGSRHRILRQVVELNGCRREEAAALQAAAARLTQRDWWPLMDSVCASLADAGRVLRIDRLEVDLGSLTAAVWLAEAGTSASDTAARAEAGQAGAALALQFERSFTAQLAVALQQAAEVQTDAELLATFLASGALPWWADGSDRQAVQRAASAQRRQPAALWRQWLGRDGGTAPNEQALLRLVAALPDGLLADLLASPSAGVASDRLGGGGRARQAAWLAVIDHAAAALGQPAARWRRAWWLTALTTTLWPAGGADGGSAWLPAWQARLGLPDATVRPALRRALDRVSAATADAGAWAPLWRALQPPDGPAVAAPHQADPAWQHLLAALADAAARPGAEGPAWRHLHQALVRASAVGAQASAALPLALRRAAADAWLAAAGQAQAAPGGPAGAHGSVAPAAGRLAALASALARLLQNALQQGLIDPAAAGLAGGAEALQQRAAAWAAAAGAGPSSGPSGPPVRPAEAAAAGAAAPALQPAHGSDSRNVSRWPGAAAAAAASVDALHVCNAGLVLLWPFLQRFAERLGLLQAGKPVRWRDGAAAQRAAVLLHCVISGDAVPPEFQLALPKLLCGLPLDEPLALDEPLSDTEQAECDALLVAAIAQAPILRQMSVAGFRGSFGLRPGQLSARDGHWLLRVERQAYDVVIDRFPWSASLVRLPWMPALLQVQW